MEMSQHRRGARTASPARNGTRVWRIRVAGRGYFKWETDRHAKTAAVRHAWQHFQALLDLRKSSADKEFDLDQIGSTKPQAEANDEKELAPTGRFNEEAWRRPENAR
jgi:hypothetical protein